MAQSPKMAHSCTDIVRVLIANSEVCMLIIMPVYSSGYIYGINDNN